MRPFPVPLTFELPNPQWRPADPEALGVENAAFLAVRSETDEDYTPTLSISGDLRPDNASVLDIAEESLALLRTQGSDVELLHRREVGDADAPGVAQVMGLSIEVDGRAFDLRQAQVVSSMYDVHDPTQRAVLLFTLTCTTGQFDALLPEFQEFVRSIRPENRASA